MRQYLNLCSIYKSIKRDGMYLYVPKSSGTKGIPPALLEMFGKPKHVMDMILKEGKTLSRAEMTKVISELKTKGYYLQMPPPQEDLLKEHLANQTAKKNLD
ncbi:MAG: YcgL domain-containing protein [Pseudomonadales bacterium]|nr:YcgL domain-containing protein [Pseudomonadales bacterium]